MPIAPEASSQHTQVVPPEGAVTRDSGVSINTVVAGSPQNSELLDRIRARLHTLAQFQRSTGRPSENTFSPVKV